MPTKRRAFEEWLPGHKLAVARFREQTGDMIREIIDEWAAETAAQKERRIREIIDEQKFLRKQMTGREALPAVQHLLPKRGLDAIPTDDREVEQ